MSKPHQDYVTREPRGTNYSATWTIRVGNEWFNRDGRSIACQLWCGRARSGNCWYDSRPVTTRLRVIQGRASSAGRIKYTRPRPGLELGRRQQTAMVSAVNGNDILSTKRQFWTGLVVAQFVGVVVLFALWRPPGNWGGEDWDFMTQLAECSRLAIQQYGEFPWWAPWHNGGMPLFAHPAFSASWMVPLSADSVVQLKLFCSFHLLLAMAGMYWLAWDYFSSALVSILVAGVFALNGAMVGYIWGGHTPVAGIAYLPWTILFLRRCEEWPSWGLAVGLSVASAALMCLHYTTMFLFVIVPVWIGVRWLRVPRATRSQILWAGVCAAGVIAALAGLRLLGALQIILENPWDPESRITTRMEFPAMALPLLFGTWGFSPGMGDGRSAHEVVSYVGIVTLILAALSLRRGWRWWHTLFVVCTLLSLGNVAWYHLSRLLETVPVLSSMRVPTRWRLLGMFGLALAAGQGLASISESRRRLRACLALALILDLSVHAWFVLAQTFRLPAQEIAGPTIRDRIVQIHTWHSLDDVRKPDQSNSAQYRFVHHGLGLIGGYESFIARSQPQTGAIGYGHPLYKGEFGPAETVRQIHWSPNRVVLEGPPGTKTWINQNRGSYWLVDGQRPYRELDVVDRSGVVEGVIPASGRLEFRIAPPFAPLGWLLQAIGALAVVGGCIGIWRRGRRPPTTS